MKQKTSKNRENQSQILAGKVNKIIYEIDKPLEK